ncbi:MAG: isoprenyl transferase [candidate division WOR-3 bacterium]
MSLKNYKLPNVLPSHIAIIMDGNGRWAKARGLPRYFGHRRGVETVRKIVRACGQWGIKYLTLYVFSTENWFRPQKEVDKLMEILQHRLISEEKELMKNNVQVRAIGQINRLPPGVQKNLNQLINKTQSNTGLILILALSYGGRYEIVEAVKKIINSNFDPDMLSPESFRNFLYDPQIPDPDLLIRTGGEKRISNFLLWQLAYTEFYFTDALWPNFTEDDLYDALLEYARRRRRFGRVEDDNLPKI